MTFFSQTQLAKLPAMASSLASTTERRVPMRVLSLGMSRTGTASMCAAYELLGIPAYHAFRFITHPEDGAWWERAADAKFYGKGKLFTKADWDHYLSDFGAVADIGGYMFWKELAEAYPEAKIVLVQRDVEKWYASMTEALLPGLYNATTDFIQDYVEPTVGPRTVNASRKLYEGYFKAKGLDGITRNAKQVYKDHYDHIRASFSPERMLNYELGSGWQSLCDFLGEPVPTAPFPHVNEQNELKRRVAAATQQTLRGAYWAIVKYLIIPLVAIGAGLLLLRR